MQTQAEEERGKEKWKGSKGAAMMSLTSREG